MRGRITVLCDNLVIGGDSIGEHGFSLFIETEEGNYLFDTGRSFSVVHNSIYHRKDLGSIKKIFLSHGHFDHTGGLPFALKLIQKEIEVVAHPHIFLNRFRIKNKEKIHSGMPFTKSYLEGLGARFTFNKGWFQITNDMFLTGEIPRKILFEKGDFSQRFAMVEGRTVTDLIMDDQALVIITDEGLLVILGCCHSGLINTLSYIIEKSVVEKIHTIIGGTHLGLLPREQAEKTVEALKNFHVNKICPCHCTGMEVSIKFYEVFRDNFVLCGVGKVLEF